MLVADHQKISRKVAINFERRSSDNLRSARVERAVLVADGGLEYCVCLLDSLAYAYFYFEIKE